MQSDVRAGAAGGVNSLPKNCFGDKDTDFGSSSSFTTLRFPSFASFCSLNFLRSSFSTQPPYFELLPSSMTSLTCLKAAVSRTGLVAVSSPRPTAFAPCRTPRTTGVSQVHAALEPMARPVVFSADEARVPAASEAAEYAARARFTDSLSLNWCAEEARALVDSFHSFDALNSFCRVSVKTCHGVLSPCGGGGAASSFLDLDCCSFDSLRPVSSASGFSLVFEFSSLASWFASPSAPSRGRSFTSSSRMEALENVRDGIGRQDRVRANAES